MPRQPNSQIVTKLTKCKFLVIIFFVLQIYIIYKQYIYIFIFESNLDFNPEEKRKTIYLKKQINKSYQLIPLRNQLCQGIFERFSGVLVGNVPLEVGARKLGKLELAKKFLKKYIYLRDFFQYWWVTISWMQVRVILANLNSLKRKKDNIKTTYLRGFLEYWCITFPWKQVLENLANLNSLKRKEQKYKRSQFIKFYGVPFQ